jgi:hypothetical protein
MKESKLITEAMKNLPRTKARIIVSNGKITLLEGCYYRWSSPLKQFIKECAVE